MTAPIRIHIESDPAHLPVVRGAVEHMCQLIGFDASAATEAVSAVDEALANIIAHAYQGQGGHSIEIELACLADDAGGCGLEVILTDRGRVVAAESIHGRDLADVRPGGLGTHIMECCVDAVEYTHPPEGGTRLRMLKYLTETPSTANEGNGSGR